jgi:hypothetical protein
MENILQSITLNMIVSTLLVLVSVWLVLLVIRKEKAFINRAVILLLLLLSINLYLNFSSPSTITIADVRNSLFPTKPLLLDYRTETRHTPEATYTRYVFRVPYPRISISMDVNAKYFNIEDIRPINRILRQMNLPEVTQGTPELVSVTGNRIHQSHYRWEKYPLGILTMQKILCQDKNSLETYHCLITIEIRSR